MELEVFKLSGETTQKKIVLSDHVFAITPNEHVVYLDIKQILANKRQGTHKAKERAEIKGSTKKIKKQKGTGTARAGSIKSPIFRGGGRVFGPRVNNSHGFKLNKKVKKLARKSVLSKKIQENSICILEDMRLMFPKTKQCVQVLNNFSCADQRVLFISNDVDRNFLLASQNISNAKMIHVSQINTYEILKAEKIFFCEKSIDIISKNLV